MKLVKEHIEFKRGLEPSDAMGINADKEVLDELKKLPIEDSWIEYFPQTVTGRYFKITLPTYWIMRFQSVNEILGLIKYNETLMANIKSIRKNKDGDIIIKLK